MPDYRSLMDAYNYRKRNNGNWVIILCIFLLIVSFSVNVYLTKNILDRDALIKVYKAGGHPGDSLKTTSTSPYLQQDSLRNLVVKLSDSISRLNMTGQPSNAVLPNRPRSLMYITLYETRWNDTIIVPFNLRKDNYEGDYTMNLQITNISGFGFKPDMVAYSSNSAYKFDFTNGDAIIEDGGNTTMSINLGEANRNSAAFTLNPVVVRLKCNVSSSAGFKVLTFKIVPRA